MRKRLEAVFIISLINQITFVIQYNQHGYILHHVLINFLNNILIFVYIINNEMFNYFFDLINDFYN